jgi:hypothetical protein
MSKDKMLGHNQNPIEEAAIKLVRNIYKALIVQNGYATQAYTGKNKTIRDNNALMSAAKVEETLRELTPWNTVIEAKENGVDVHSAPIKTHKLDIVTNLNTEPFGQYIIDKEDSQLSLDLGDNNVN